MASSAKELAPLGFIAAVAVAVLVVEIPDTTPTKGAEVAVEPSKVAVLPDGSKTWVQRVKVADGGTELRKLLAPDCARRPKGAAVTACQRNVAGKTVDQGVLNRIPIGEAVGIGCELVACSVVSGEDPDATEDDRVAEVKKGKDAGK